MTDILFYHLTATPLEGALPALMEKALGAGYRTVIRTKDEPSMDKLNTLLWTYNPATFLPHGSRKDGNEAEQPVYLTTLEENPNGANLLAVTDGSVPTEASVFTRILDIFDGRDEQEVTAARVRWKTYKDAGQNLQYWQQQENGGWAKKG